MALHDLARKLTYEDYVLIPDDGQRHEIIDGEHYVSPAPFVPHQELLVELTVRLGASSRPIASGGSSSRPPMSSFRSTTSFSPTCCSSPTSGPRSSD